MKLLILGGTRFVGRGIAQAGLSAGHELTLFNRGKSNQGLFKEVETLIGDRDGGLDVLKHRYWDAVIDCSGYVPRLVGDSAKLLADVVAQYTLISSISSYADFSQPGIDEQSPQATLADPTVEEVNGETYGPLKTHCERVLEEAFNGRILHIRPALIVGPNDGQDLFPYWVHRVAQGGNVLVPGKPTAPMQFIDANDLGKWVVHATEQQLTGAFITTGPDYLLTMETLLACCKTVSQSDADFTYVGDQFLLEQGLEPNSETPWWIPESHKGYGLFNNQKAIAAGLTFKPLAETVINTLQWLVARSSDYEWTSGLTLQKERELLELYNQ